MRARIESARASGLDITADMYPYAGAGTGLSSVLPPWAAADEGLYENLKNPEMRAKIRTEALSPTSDWEAMTSLCGPEGVMPIGLFITENSRLKVRILLAIAYGASIGGILTPIGTPPNLLLLGYLEEIGMKAPTFTEWMGMTSPVVVTMLLLMPLILSYGMKDEPIGRMKESIEPMTKDQKKLLWIIGGLSLLLFLNTPIKPWYPGLGLNEKGLLLGAGLLLFMPGIDLLDWEDSRAIPYEIIFLFGAGFSIAQAFGSTHLAEAVAQKLAFVQELPLWMTLAVIALAISFSTEITSNTALTSIALPVMAELYGVDHPETLLVLMVTTVAASYAFMLPIATPPNAIVMSSRVIRVKTMAAVGFFIDLIGVAIVSVTAYLLWQWVV